MSTQLALASTAVPAALAIRADRRWMLPPASGSAIQIPFESVVEDEAQLFSSLLLAVGIFCLGHCRLLGGRRAIATLGRFDETHERSRGVSGEGGPRGGGRRLGRRA